MYIAIDVILVAVMIATVYRATKRGFVLSLFSLFTVGVSLFAAWMFYEAFGMYINTEFVCDSVEEYISVYVERMLEQNSIAPVSEEFVASLPKGLLNTAALLGVDISGAVDNVYSAVGELVIDASAAISIAVSNIISFTIIFFAVFIILKLVSILLNRYAQTERFRKINIFLGFLFGTAEAFVLCVLISKAAIAILGAYGTFVGDPSLLDVAEKTIITKFIVSNIPW